MLSILTSHWLVVPEEPWVNTIWMVGSLNEQADVNIADIDGDGKLNATYVSGKFFCML